MPPGMAPRQGDQPAPNATRKVAAPSGPRGSTHGVRNERSPAANAIRMVMFEPSIAERAYNRRREIAARRGEVRGKETVKRIVPSSKFQVQSSRPKHLTS